MASAGVNVLRYSALFGGISYGFYHQYKLNTQAKANRIEADFKHQASLVDKAKAEWTKRSIPMEKKTPGGDVISDPNDPKFDLEAYLKAKMADEAT